MPEAKKNIIGCWEVDVCGVCRPIKIGEEFLVVEEKHKWRVYPNAEQHDFYTVLHFGKRLKVLATNWNRPSTNWLYIEFWRSLSPSLNGGGGITHGEGFCSLLSK